MTRSPFHTQQPFRDLRGYLIVRNDEARETDGLPR